MTRWSSLMATTVLTLSALGFLAPARAQSVSADALMKARNNCLASVAEVVGAPVARLKVLHQTSNTSAISADVMVPNAAAAWGCLTDRQGNVEDVYFKGSEGAL